MKRLLPAIALAAACATAPAARPHRPVAADALAGLTLGLPAPDDARLSQSVGCGMLSSDLAQRTNQLLVDSLSAAGARLTLSEKGPVVLRVSLRQATVGAEHTASRRTDRDSAPPPPSLEGSDRQGPGSLIGRNGSLVHDSDARAQVELEGTLVRDGQVVWRGTVQGRASSAAPCLEAVVKVREALRDAVETLREELLPELRGAARP